jgi:hypothetical protein
VRAFTMPWAQRKKGCDMRSLPVLFSIPASSAQVAFPAIPTSRIADRVIHARRLARMAFGVALVITGIALALNTALHFPVHAGTLIFGGWLVAFAVMGTVYALARVSTFLKELGRIEDRHLAASLAWPIAGLALVLPLTIHAVVFGHGERFDEWVAWSCLLVGHCHLALALMGAWRMMRLARDEGAMKPAAIYGVTVGLAMIPGAIFLFIPPFLVAATGLAFLFILWAPSQIILRERTILAVGR